MRGTEGLKGIQVGQTYAVSGHPKTRVHGPFHSHHESKGLSLIAAMRQDGAFN